jgi:hypothetical protein
MFLREVVLKPPCDVCQTLPPAAVGGGPVNHMPLSRNLIKDRQEFLGNIEDYRQELVPLIVLLT